MLNPESFFFEERPRWFLWLPVLIAGGIGTYFVLDFEPSPLWIGASPLWLIIAYLFRNNNVFQPLSAALLTFFLGFNAAQIESWFVRAPLLTHPMEATSVTGRLMHADVLPDNKTRILLKDPYIKGVSKAETPRYIRVKTKMPLADLPPAGAIVNVWGPLWPPGESVAPRTYDFRRYSYFKQLGGMAVAYAGPRLRKTEDPPFFWDGFSLVFEKMRRTLLDKSYQHLSGPEADMTATLLSGSQSSIDADVMKAMRASGLSHLLSISGIHVSMFALLVYIPLRFLLALVPMVALRFHTKKIAAFAAIFSTAAYVMLVGPETPTVRSALMTGIVLFAVIADRKAMSMRLVALAAMVIMLLAP
ncbi:MAG: ComEC/Rec2 family competence protein, partial [Bdellovibrionales bacterium]